MSDKDLIEKQQELLDKYDKALRDAVRSNTFWVVVFTLIGFFFGVRFALEYVL